MNYVKFVCANLLEVLARVEHPVSKGDYVEHDNKLFKVIKISHVLNKTMGAVVSDTETIATLVKI